MSTLINDRMTAHSFTFDRYVLNTNPLVLMEGQRRISISRRQLEVLALLVQASGYVVPKAKVLELIWQGAFVEPGSLTQCIFLLRRTLGKMVDGSEIIETIPRQGYRIAPAALHRTGPASKDAPKDAHGSASDTFPVPHGMEEQDQFRLLVESIEEYIIYMLDRSGRVLTWNAGAEHRTGYRSAEILGEHFSRFFSREDIDTGVPDRELATATKQGRYQSEGWRLRKNGERFWANSVLTAMRSPSGRLIGFAKIVRDLTARKQFEDALLTADAVLRQQRDRLNAAAESSMDALSICTALRDANGEIEDFVCTYLNHNVEQMLDLPRNVLLGSRVCELLPSLRGQGLMDAFLRVIATSEPYVAILPIRKGVVGQWVRLQALRLGDGLAITASDITALKAAEASLAIALADQYSERP